jgi:hypothetical protein
MRLSFNPSAPHFLTKFRRVVFRISFQHALEHYPFGRVGYAFCRGYYLNAVIAERPFMYRTVVTASGKSVELIDDNIIEILAETRTYYTLKVGAVIVRSRHCFVNVCVYYTVALPLGKLGYNSNLPVNRLFLLA